MADEQQPVGEAEATPAGESQQEALTASEVEAQWKHRVSQKDAAHAAEAKALRSQIASLEASQKDSTTRTATENDAMKTELENARRELDETRRQATVETRTVRYPFAADALDPEILATMDEVKLAGLEARLTAGQTPGRPIDPSTPARTSAQAKPQEEKSVEELRADLARFGPEFAREISSS